MIESERLPLPVALPWRRWERAVDTAQSASQRIRHASDAGYALLKYVALIRLADWIRGGLEVETEAVETFERILWGAAADDWWRVAQVLERGGLRRVAPNTPNWVQIPKEHLDLLNRGRRYRHSGLSAPPNDPDLARRLDAALPSLVAAAGPLLACPLVRFREAARERLLGPGVPPAGEGEWTIAVEIGEVTLALDPLFLVVSPDDDAHKDLYIYERLSQRGMIVERDHFQLERQGQPPDLAQVARWTQGRLRAARAARGVEIESLDDAALMERVRVGVAETLAREWRVLGRALERIPRAEVDEAFRGLGPAGCHAAILTGGSGIGKTRELAEWLLTSRRVKVWVRASAWRGESLRTLIGRAVSGDDTPLPRERLVSLARANGLAVAIDGVNEANDPAALVGTLAAELASLEVPTHLVMSTRREGVYRALHALGQARSWLVSCGGLRAGVLELGPLPLDAAGRLWRGLAFAGGLSFERLPPGSRRLLQIPFMATLATELTYLGQSWELSADSIIERYVESQAAQLERVLLRHLASRMFASARQSLSSDDLSTDVGPDRIIADALRGLGDYGDALAQLVDKGLLVRAGRTGADEAWSVAFTHDRVLQWFVGRIVAAQSTSVGRDAYVRGDGWVSAFRRVAGSPALVSGLGQALVLRYGAEAPMGERQLSGGDPHEVLAVREYIRALAERDPDASSRWLDRVWDESTSRQKELRRRVRAELLALAADTADLSLLVRGLFDASMRTETVGVLTRVRRSAPDVVLGALSRCWGTVERQPWRHPSAVATVGYALLHVSIAEGGQRTAAAYTELTRAYASRLMNRDGGWFARATRKLVVEALAAAAQGIALAVPSGPVRSVAEIARFFRMRASAREVYRPLVDLYAGRIEVAAAEPAVLLAGSQREVGPVALVERALIMATRRPSTRRAALDLTVALGERTHRINPVPMAGQSVLYVLSNYLERFPDAQDWEERFDQFEHLLEGWLRAAPERRWTAASGREYKSLFASAHMLLAPRRRGGRPSELVPRLWDEAIGRNPQLALDLIDDLTVVAFARGAYGSAVAAMEPWLAADDRDPAVLRAAASLLAGIGERDPELVGAALANGREPNRVRVSALVDLGRPPTDFAGHAIMLDFDDALVLDEAVSPTVAKVLAHMLVAPSFRAFISYTLRLAANRLTEERLFVELGP